MCPACAEKTAQLNQILDEKAALLVAFNEASQIRDELSAKMSQKDVALDNATKVYYLFCFLRNYFLSGCRQAEI